MAPTHSASKGDPVKKSSNPFGERVPCEADHDPAGRSREDSPYALVTAADPPIYMSYETPPAFGQNRRIPRTRRNTASGNGGEKLRRVGWEYELVYPGADRG